MTRNQMVVALFAGGMSIANIARGPYVNSKKPLRAEDIEEILRKAMRRQDRKRRKA